MADNKAYSFRRSLLAVAVGLGDRLGLNVHFVGNPTASTNGKDIYIPSGALAAKNKGLLWGFLIHEASHVRFSDFAVALDPTPAYARGIPAEVWKRFMNALEDAFIERRIQEEFPGCGVDLRAAREELVAQGGYPLPEPDGTYTIIEVLESFTLAWLLSNCTKMSVMEPAALAWESVLAGAIGPERVEHVKGILAENARAERTSDNLAICGRLFDYMKDVFEALRSAAGMSSNQSEDDGAEGPTVTLSGHALSKQPNSSENASDRNASENEARESAEGEEGKEGKGEGREKNGKPSSGSEKDSGESKSASSSKGASDDASESREGEGASDGEAAGSASGAENDGKQAGKGNGSDSSAGTSSQTSSESFSVSASGGSSSSDGNESAGAGGDLSSKAGASAGGGSSSGTDAGRPSSESSSEAPEPPKNRKGRGRRRKNDAQNDEPLGKPGCADWDAAKPAADTFGDALSRAASRSGRRSDEQRLADLLDGLSLSQRAEERRRHAEAVFATNHPEDIPETKREVARIARALKNHVYALSWADRAMRAKGKSTDLRRIGRILSGDMRVFRASAPHMEPDCAVKILVDLSGSMHNLSNRPGVVRPAETALAAAAAIREAFMSLASVPVSVDGFGTRVLTAVHWNEPKAGARRIMSRINGFMSEDSLGATELLRAAAYSGFDLMMRKEKRRLLLIVTDGAPTDCSLEATGDFAPLLRRLEGEGVEVFIVGIGLGTDTGKEIEGLLGPKHFTDVRRVDDLGDAMFDMVRGRMSAFLNS